MAVTKYVRVRAYMPTSTLMTKVVRVKAMYTFNILVGAAAAVLLIGV
jgi:hypothetical protein